MSAWESSSLAASDGLTRHSSGLLKNTKLRLSKQHIMSNKMFGSKMGKHGKDFKIGKMFKKKGKGIMKGSTTAEPHKGIGPSVEEFDDMMGNASKSLKKKGFSRKMFG